MRVRDESPSPKEKILHLSDEGEKVVCSHAHGTHKPYTYTHASNTQSLVERSYQPVGKISTSSLVGGDDNFHNS